MFENIENPKITGVYSGTARIHFSTPRRSHNSLMLRLAGHGRYTFPDRSMDIYPGALVFLPIGSSYEFETLGDTPCSYVSIVFDADCSDIAPCCFPADGFADTELLQHSLADLWNLGGTAEHFKCYSLFFDLLAYFEAMQNMRYADRKLADIISPAIAYLKAHIYDCDLKIQTLHELCGISGAYFRKIFGANYAVSPQKYILERRLSHAKTILDGNDFHSIGEIAAAVGYSDPLYFSRAFKKAYGLSPSQYAKGNLPQIPEEDEELNL